MKDFVNLAANLSFDLNQEFYLKWMDIVLHCEIAT